MVDIWTKIGQAFGPGLALILVYLVSTLGTAFNKWVKLKLNPGARKESVADTEEYNFKVSVAVELALEHLGPRAMRVYYTKFHNGEFFDDGSSIQKKTRVFEALRPGVAPLPAQYAIDLISRVPEEIKLILNPGPSYVSLDSLKDGAFKWSCQQQGVQTLAREAVYRGKSFPQNLIGYVGVDFDGGLDMPIPENIHVLGELAVKIGQLSDNYRGAIDESNN